MSWLDRWRTFKRTKRHYPDTGTYTTTDGTVTIWCPSVQQSAATLPRNLKRLREARRLTPTQLASKAKVSASTVRAMETPGGYAQGGARSDPNPTLMSLLAVAQALGVGVEALIEEREP